jgi:hypothetical protein
MKELLAKSPSGLFASRTLTGHLLRGGVAIALLAQALSIQHERPWLAMLAALGALAAMRGCPMCWTIGLVETVLQRLRRSG